MLISIYLQLITQHLILVHTILTMIHNNDNIMLLNVITCSLSQDDSHSNDKINSIAHKHRQKLSDRPVSELTGCCWVILKIFSLDKRSTIYSVHLTLLPI